MRNKLLSIPFFSLLLLLASCGTEFDSNAITENNADTETHAVENFESVDDEYVDKEKSEPQINTSADEDSHEEANPEDDYEQVSSAIAVSALEEMSVHFIDVGQADASLFSYSYEGEDYHILYDTGNWNQSHTVNYLNDLGIKELDLVIISHPHADHIGGVDQILDGGITMGEIWMSGDETTSQTFERAIDAVERYDIDYVEPRTGEEFQIGPLELLVVNPDSLNGNLHDGSVSVRFDYGEVSFLFTGDAEAAAEQRMLNTGLDLDVDILQLGHHGSSTSTTTAFFEAVNPSTSIYSAGSGNSYGHPHQEVVDRVANAEGDLYGTDTHGTVIVNTDGSSYTVETQTEEKESASSEPPEDCVDINSASFEELQRIHRIGPDRAEQIPSLRPFSSVQDMIRIKGIGEASVAEIKEEGVACVR